MSDMWGADPDALDSLATRFADSAGTGRRPPHLGPSRPANGGVGGERRRALPVPVGERGDPAPHVGLRAAALGRRQPADQRRRSAPDLGGRGRHDHRFRRSGWPRRSGRSRRPGLARRHRARTGRRLRGADRRHPAGHGGRPRRSPGSPRRAGEPCRARLRSPGVQSRMRDPAPRFRIAKPARRGSIVLPASSRACERRQRRDERRARLRRVRHRARDLAATWPPRWCRRRGPTRSRGPQRRPLMPGGISARRAGEVRRRGRRRPRGTCGRPRLGPGGARSGVRSTGCAG